LLLLLLLLDDGSKAKNRLAGNYLRKALMGINNNKR